MVHIRLTYLFLEFPLTITFNFFPVKNIIYKTFSAASVSLLFFACKPDLGVPVSQKGSLDFTRFVAVGNSITAGYADNALYYNQQINAYPNLIAQQFKSAGVCNFKQPLVDAASVGVGSSLNSRLALRPIEDCQGSISLAPVYVAQSGDVSIFSTSVASEGPFNNLGIPGAKATTIIYPGYGNPANGFGNYNPFFTRMTSNPASASILSEALEENPTFFSLLIGHDDVLSYALSGGTADAITPSAGPAGAGFDASVDVIINALTANGAKGIIGNVADITSIPFFTTVPYNGLLLDDANAEALTYAYSGLGITFQAGYNGFIIEDAGAPGGLRQIQEGELILLSVPQDSLKCAGWGSMKPIPNQFVLTENEITSITEAIDAYNTKLKSVADEKGLAFIDVNAFMSKVKTGIVYNGVSIKTQFVSGGAFSLDGVHLTPIGNALMANEFIKAINAKYGSTIPQVNATNYKGVDFP